ncbi:MAG: LytTR family DNA-binding domain-containing protein [Polyangiaceae bacterium]|jgi:DNA-binding LytR/AlgR family response regulator
MAEQHSWERDFLDPAPPQSQTHPHQQPISSGVRVVGRRRGSLVFIDATEVWAFEAANRLTFVHCASGRFDLDVSLKELEAVLGSTMMRPHRNWLVPSAHVREWRRYPDRSVLFVGDLAGSDGRGLEVPVAADRFQAVRDALLAGTVGLRRRLPPSVSAATKLQLEVQ